MDQYNSSPKAKESQRRYRKCHKKEISLRNAKYRENNREKMIIYKRQWSADLKSWEKTFYSILSRCTSKIHPYFLKGIKCLITKEELRILWFRDKAYLMEKPTIDRFDPSKNYTFENCQYLEHRINSLLKGVHCATSPL